MKNALWAVAASGGLTLLLGCALAANPQPPTLWLPNPVTSLTAARIGDEVRLHWNMPRDSTDKLRLKGPQRARICQMEAPSGEAVPHFRQQACQMVGDAQFAPGKPAEFSVQLPPRLIAGIPHAISYYVELENQAGKTAGPSNPALAATGSAPPPVIGLRLESRPDGILLRWRPAAPEPNLVLRIHRLLVAQPGASETSGMNGAPPPERQTLEVDLEKSDPGDALDRDATLNHIWRYTAERVLKLDIDGHALEVAGRSSQVVTIDAKDIFPPAIPADLAAVADQQARSIDLSWTPDTAPDLAGYIVYRRDLTSGTPLERISPKAPIVPPAFEDRDVQPGHRYVYSVSAIDHNGNESARSSEIEEELPQ